MPTLVTSTLTACSGCSGGPPPGPGTGGDGGGNGNTPGGGGGSGTYGGVAYTWACRSKGGEANLRGFAELGDPSTPPRYYLSCTFSGHYRGDVFDDGACTTGAGNFFTIDLSGSATIDPVTNTLVSHGTQLISTQTGPEAPTEIDGPFSCGGVDLCFATCTTTKTSVSIVGISACCPSGEGKWQKHSGNRTCTLGGEDTEDDAIAREAFEWTAWGAGSCCSQNNIRTGATVFKMDSQVRISMTGTAGTIRTLKMKYVRRLSSTSDIFEDYLTDTFSITLDGAGMYSQDFDVPSAYGYQTCFSSFTLEVP